MKGIIRIVKSLEDSELLMKGIRKIIQNEAKEKKEAFIVRYQVHQVQDYWEILAGKEINKAEEGIVRTGYVNKRQDYENKMNF